MTKIAGVMMICAWLGLALFHPYGEVKGGVPRTILSGGNAGPEVIATFEQSCQNCHSGQTKWPWYSYVPPVSWMVERDVATARRHMDLGAWETYSAAEKLERLSQISSLMRNHVMPPRRYLIVHPEARLSPAAIAAVARWTHQERARLKAGLIELNVR